MPKQRPQLFYSNQEHTLFSHKNEYKSNEVSLSNLRFSQYNLGLVFHTIYYRIFHPCYLLLLISTPAFSVSPSVCPRSKRKMTRAISTKLDRIFRGVASPRHALNLRSRSCLAWVCMSIRQSETDLRGCGLFESEAEADVIDGQWQIATVELEQHVSRTVDQSSSKLSLHVHHALPNTNQPAFSHVYNSQ